MKKQSTEAFDLGHPKFSTPWYQEFLQRIKPWAAGITLIISILGGMALFYQVFYQHVINLTDRQAKLEGRLEEIKNDLDRIRGSEIKDIGGYPYSPK